MLGSMRSALLFIAIGLGLYGGLFLLAEGLVRRNGHANPVFKVLTADRTRYDWLILGASHAMPLAFDGMEAEIETATGRTILNVSGPGTGPLYSAALLEVFRETGHRADAVLYVADAFAFGSAAWNEDRIADPGLLARTPFDMRVAGVLIRFVWNEGVRARAVADYLTGFSKINDRTRFRRDAWEGEAQFDRVFRPSAAADRRRIDYLYPSPTVASRRRYLETLSRMVRTLESDGCRVVVLRPPLPGRFRRLLPDEAGFDADLSASLAGTGAEVVDLSASLDDPAFYFDTDHLNRTGVRRLVDGDLRTLLGLRSSPMVKPQMRTTRRAPIGLAYPRESLPSPPSAPQRSLAIRK
jgi:hypothetical protein